jgi:hypothetical protein
VNSRTILGLMLAALVGCSGAVPTVEDSTSKESSGEATTGDGGQPTESGETLTPDSVKWDCRSCFGGCITCTNGWTTCTEVDLIFCP